MYLLLALLTPYFCVWASTDCRDFMTCTILSMKFAFFPWLLLQLNHT